MIESIEFSNFKALRKTKLPANRQLIVQQKSTVNRQRIVHSEASRTATLGGRSVGSARRVPYDPAAGIVPGNRGPRRPQRQNGRKCGASRRCPLRCHPTSRQWQRPTERPRVARRAVASDTNLHDALWVRHDRPRTMHCRQNLNDQQSGRTYPTSEGCRQSNPSRVSLLRASFASLERGERLTSRRRTWPPNSFSRRACSATAGGTSRPRGPRRRGRGRTP